MQIRETQQPTPKYRRDYREPDFWIDTVRLDFVLGEESSTVRARLELRRNGDHDRALVLDGEELETLSIAVDGEERDASGYTIDGDQLILPDVGGRFELETLVRIKPQENLALSGLYKSSGNFCTQCEAEGFRRITWFLDRPDVMAKYTTSITADLERYPVLLSNGNRVREEELPDGQHRVTWEDPFKKPSYLFALVAGTLARHSGQFTTRSGRSVTLEIWVEPQNIDACEHALRALRNSMRWDEEAFGREYDLDIYMVVAVSDFNMGAMENKGLNIFNSKYVLARPDTATDDDYEAIEGVIGHEYFHNWTGNRVTCRDWFQLTLKEGLTVFRDQQFSAQMTSPAVKRIHDVVGLRNTQFTEDAGPMAHPIRPESYIEMDNFYTSTVYQKGAEVIRMYDTLLGTDGFRRGMDVYFQRHDGEAVTCDDFRAAMADANERDLAQFETWYLQAGTPRLGVSEAWDAAAGRYTLSFEQRAPEGVSPDRFEPLLLPVRAGLLGPDGAELPMVLEGLPDVDGGAPTERVLELTEPRQSFTFTGLAARPVPSLLRGFSAPVILEMERSRESLVFQMAHDADAFNRWDAGQVLFSDAILALAEDAAAGRDLALPAGLAEAFGAVLADDGLDGSIQSLMLTLPDEAVLAQRMSVVDPDALYAARTFVKRALAGVHRDALHAMYAAARPTGPYAAQKADIDRRRKRMTALAYLTALPGPEAPKLAKAQLDSADNMTDSEAALACLVQLEAPERAAALAEFYERWKHDPLVIDKWFSLQASSRLPGAARRVRDLVEHQDFKLSNPNRVRALVSTFSRSNPTGFHAADGEGYTLLADIVVQLDGRNPQVAARLAGGFNGWKRYDDERQALMQAQLERIAAHEDLSKNTYEIVSRALAMA